MDNTQEYMSKRRKLSGLFFETALPNEYLVVIGRGEVKPVLGGRRFKLFRKFLRVPAYVQRLKFKTDNANIDYQGIGIEGYASWRIDPQDPKVAISTLDFFDDQDPMARTNEELKTICIEAVRHVIANMSIDDALKKKDEIGDNLKEQLKTVEKRWGILFDQVGIEKVTIMSNRLFADLQAEFRNKLHLTAERNRISTESEIAKQENTTREQTMVEKLESEQRIKLRQMENNSKIQERDMQEKHAVEQKKRKLELENFRSAMAADEEKANKQKELDLLRKQLAIELQQIDHQLLAEQLKSDTLQQDIVKQQQTGEQIKRRVSQLYSSEELLKRLIERLPDIYKAINIKNYSVMDSASGESLSPVGKIFNELLTLLQNSSLEFGRKQDS